MNRLKLRLCFAAPLILSISPNAWAANLGFGGQPQTGTISSAAQTDSYTFSANANDVISFTLTTTSGSLIPKIVVYTSGGTLISSTYAGSPYNCSGSALELNTVHFQSTGGYIVNVSDCNSTHTGNYSLYAQRTNNPTGAATLQLGQVQTGSIAPAQSNAYTFTANANDQIDFTVSVTSGNLIPRVALYNPTGSLLSSNYAGSPYNCSGSTVEMNTVTLPTSGNYTVLVTDCGDTNTGNYSLYAQLTDSPVGPVSLLLGQVQTGTIGSSAQSSSYSLTASANDVLNFTLTRTSGSLIPKIRLYNPNGSLLSWNYAGSPYNCSGSTVEMNTVTLPANGTYTVLVGDCGDTNTGNFALYSQRMNNPSGAVSLSFGQTLAGLLASPSGSNTYSFAANANDVVSFTMTTTNGTLIPKIGLYSPGGTLVSSNYADSPYNCSGSTVEMNTISLSAAGTYTLLVGDCGDTLTGNYAIYMQRTNNPTGFAAVLWGQVQNGTIGSAAQSNSLIFAGTSGNVVNFTMVSTGGGLIPKLRLYSANGALINSNYAGSPYNCSGSSVQMNSVSLTQTGTYTMLVGDCGDTNTGAYTISSQCFGVCTVPTSTNTTMGASPNPSYIGQNVTLMATVSATAATGSVTFKDGAATLGTVALSGGAASMMLSTLTLGAHSLTAAYSGDGSYAASTSAPYTQTVNSPPTYAISGTLTYFGGGLGGATIILSGTQSASTVSNGSGAYSFTGLASGGTYTVTPSFSGLTFSPVNQTFTNLSGSQTANFSATGQMGSAGCIGVFSNSTGLNCSAMSQSTFQGNAAVSIGSPTNFYGALTLVGNVPFADAAGMALYNAGAGGGASVSLDLYNTSFNGGIPQAKIKAIDDGNYSDHLTFWTKNPGAPGFPVTEKVRVASGGNVGIGTTTPTLGPLQMGSGAYVTAGGVWTNASDRNVKENFAPVAPTDILQKIDLLPLTEWNYRNEAPSIRHIGPVAQDFFSIFGVGGASTSISTIDPSGIALAGIQALDAKSLGRSGQLTELKKQLDAKTEELRILQERLSQLESVLHQHTGTNSW